MLIINGLLYLYIYITIIYIYNPRLTSYASFLVSILGLGSWQVVPQGSQVAVRDKVTDQVMRSSQLKPFLGYGFHATQMVVHYR